jgi:hypothetical protein
MCYTYTFASYIETQMKYLPFLDGKYSTAPALVVLAKAPNPIDQFIFQIDEKYTQYIANKQSCRAENIRKYFCEKGLCTSTVAPMNRYMVNQLVREHPRIFTFVQQDGEHILTNSKTGENITWRDDWVAVKNQHYLSLFYALCSQVQEDVAICQLEGDKDWLAAIHLSSANHWAPADKIGRPFSSVHGIVPGMEKLNQNYFKMLMTAVNKGPYTRFAWGISTDTRLNHHPLPPPNIDPIYWQGRKVEHDSSHIYLRVEKQNIIGFAELNAFLFTIRTFFYDIEELSVEEKKALFMAVEGMSPESLEYKGLTDKVEVLRKRLVL